MFAGLFDDLKLKLDGMLKLAVAGAVAAAAATAAFFCLAVVLFLWTQQNYGTLEAWTALAALFVAVALIGLIVVLVVRKRGRTIVQRRAEEPSVAARLLQEPAVLLTGLQVARMLGARGLLPLILIGAVAGGLMMNRSENGTRHRMHAEAGPLDDSD